MLQLRTAVNKLDLRGIHGMSAQGSISEWKAPYQYLFRFFRIYVTFYAAQLVILTEDKISSKENISDYDLSSG